MSGTLQAAFESILPRRPLSDPVYVTEAVSGILTSARRAAASDVHLIPARDAFRMAWRVDGVLQSVWDFPVELAPRIVARLKVMAELLTYQTEMPQEGRIRESGTGTASSTEIEMRVSTFPTLFGEKVVVRLLGERGEFQQLANLGLTDDVRTGLAQLIQATQGTILVAGPAGSGKTTTLYACLREITAQTQGQRSLVSLEDPIEAVIPGVSQSQVNLAAGFDLTTGLRSLMRQDPEVIMVGEIRDRSTAEIVFQAALTGHLVLTTFHAGSAASVVSRLSEMGIEPYLLRSGILGVVCQRLVRRLCQCSRPGTDERDKLGLRVESFRVPVGCAECRGTGYQGRLVLSEILLPDQTDVGRAILSRGDSAELEALARQAGMLTRWQRACSAIEAGQTSPAEIRRVLGLGDV
ncbi:MAG: type secretory pathway, ATPase PulE/Tfp pilus assembly pathway, ATPase PilB [Planctomycetaceae bacterium]|nr:type secretory pathway, ATPase PulE/Tfp pilus assembly pathway, ATPase PilB [Planctomycetaceae bacterium]